MSWQTDDLAELRLDRHRARSKLKRLYRDIRRYMALYRNPLIDAQIAAWKAEYRSTWEWKRDLERRIKAAPR